MSKFKLFNYKAVSEGYSSLEDRINTYLKDNRASVESLDIVQEMDSQNFAVLIKFTTVKICDNIKIVGWIPSINLDDFLQTEQKRVNIKLMSVVKLKSTNTRNLVMYTTSSTSASKVELIDEETKQDHPSDEVTNGRTKSNDKRSNRRAAKKSSPSNT